MKKKGKGETDWLLTKRCGGQPSEINCNSEGGGRRGKFVTDGGGSSTICFKSRVSASWGKTLLKTKAPKGIGFEDGLPLCLLRRGKRRGCEGALISILRVGGGKIVRIVPDVRGRLARGLPERKKREKGKREKLSAWAGPKGALQEE